MEGPDGSAEYATIAQALQRVVSDGAEPPMRSVERADPHRPRPILEQRCHEFGHVLVQGQRPAAERGEAGKGADPQSAVARDEQAVDVLLGETLALGRVPRDDANAIEAKKAELPTEPEIPIWRLGHRVDVADGEPVPDGPRGMRVLADLQRRVQRERARGGGQQHAGQGKAQRDGVRSVRSRHGGASYSQAR